MGGRIVDRGVGLDAPATLDKGRKYISWLLKLFHLYVLFDGASGLLGYVRYNVTERNLNIFCAIETKKQRYTNLDRTNVPRLVAGRWCFIMLYGLGCAKGNDKGNGPVSCYWCLVSIGDLFYQRASCVWKKALSGMAREPVFAVLNSPSSNAISDLLSSLEHLSVHLMKI